MSEELQKELEEAKAALEEAKKGQVSKETLDRLAFLEDDHKKLIKARDDAKEAKRLEEEKRLSEQGLNGQLSEYQERDKKELEAILATVPESLRGDLSDETLPLATRLSLARKFSTTKGKPPEFREGGEGGDNSKTRQEFDSLSPVAKSEFIKSGGKVTE
jgi:hypothetical protein